jgi:hypothetical protein
VVIFPSPRGPGRKNVFGLTQTQQKSSKRVHFGSLNSADLRQSTQNSLPTQFAHHTLARIHVPRVSGGCPRVERSGELESVSRCEARKNLSASDALPAAGTHLYDVPLFFLPGRVSAGPSPHWLSLAQPASAGRREKVSAWWKSCCSSSS